MNMRLYTRILRTISENKTDSKSLGVALQNFPYQVNLGTLLSNLKLLFLIIGFLTVKCILNLQLNDSNLITFLTIPFHTLQKLSNICRLKSSIGPASSNFVNLQSRLAFLACPFGNLKLTR